MLRVAEHWSGTDTGLQRRANEDSLLVRSPLFVVADGMGGAQAGEVASRMAVESFSSGLLDGEDPQSGLAEQVREANARIHRVSRERPEHAGMGTTITAVYVGERDVSVAHVGDSRAYCLRDGELLRLTDDHSLVDELIRQGRLTPQEAEEHPQRSVITRALGPEVEVEVDVSSIRGRSQDIYLLCSDGLTTMVGEQRLRQLLAAGGSLRSIGQALIAAANAAGGKDNITVVLLRLEDVPGVLDEDGHATTSGLAPLAGDASAAAASARGEGKAGAVEPRRPRLPSAAPPAATGARRRRTAMRRLRAPLIALVVVGALVAGAYLALQSVFFIGTNQRGLVTVFRGVPYELPAGIRLYSSYYVSGVSAATLAPARRQALLDHAWRSESAAASLVRQLELGQLSGGLR